ncbi:UNVERIFIED_CONTAM: hypothetical protein HDU68_008086 [Siphonaria sp. JEL0065]|nr:hypothetical protein HDU68_008086 [Siphonaria sp. JEL0065]
MAESLFLLSRALPLNVNQPALDAAVDTADQTVAESPGDSLPTTNNHQANRAATPVCKNIDDSSSGMRLGTMEADIDLKILNHMSGEDLELRQQKKTVSAVQNIVGKKLYKEKSVSLEIYFKEYWKISRAQVYRFLDCASVLAQLDGFTRIPTRERLCRTLKFLAKTKCDIRVLWAASLGQLRGNPDSITSTMLNQLWADLLSERKVTGLPEGSVILPVGFDNATWETFIENIVQEYAAEWMEPSSAATPIAPVHIPVPLTVMHQSARAPVCNSFTTKRRTPVISGIASFLESSDGETHLRSFSNDELTSVTQTLSMIGNRNHHLEYYEEGEWRQAKGSYWRIGNTKEQPPIMLTSLPPVLHESTKTTKLPRQKVSRSKLSSANVGLAYESFVCHSGTDNQNYRQAVPIAAEPPRLFYGAKLKRRNSSSNVASGDDSDSEEDVDYSSDYQEGGLKFARGTAIRMRKKSKKFTPAKVVPKEEGAGHQGHFLETHQTPATNFEVVSDAITDDVMESCWSDFAPEELEAVAVLQRYRSDKTNSASPLEHRPQLPSIK